MSMLAVVMGAVHPVSSGWHLEDPVHIPFSDGKWMLIVKHSQFHVFIEGQKPDDLPTFMNEVGSIVQGCLDSLGFHLVSPLRAEIRSMVIDGNMLIQRRPGWPELSPELLTDPSIPHVTADRLQPFLAAAMCEPLVRFALADLRMAIESPDDTGYLAYRAVESVRQWFLVGEEDDDSARKQSWIDMRAALEIDESRLRWLDRLARQRRHGAATLITESQRKESLLLARGVVARFIAHINERGTPPVNI
jgi:hypothetical protein